MVQQMTKTVFVDDRGNEHETRPRAERSEAFFDAGMLLRGAASDDQVHDVLRRICRDDDSMEAFERLIRATRGQRASDRQLERAERAAQLVEGPRVSELVQGDES